MGKNKSESSNLSLFKRLANFLSWPFKKIADWGKRLKNRIMSFFYPQNAPLVPKKDEDAPKVPLIPEGSPSSKGGENTQSPPIRPPEPEEQNQRAAPDPDLKQALMSRVHALNGEALKLLEKPPLELTALPREVRMPLVKELENCSNQVALLQMDSHECNLKNLQLAEQKLIEALQETRNCLRPKSTPDQIRPS